jgi:hypothetical protein
MIRKVMMLGMYSQVYQQAQSAIRQVTGQACACTWPLVYCAAGQIVAYGLDAYVVGQPDQQTFYFDGAWHLLAAPPAGAQPCCVL